MPCLCPSQPSFQVADSKLTKTQAAGPCMWKYEPVCIQNDKQSCMAFLNKTHFQIIIFVQNQLNHTVLKSEPLNVSWSYGACKFVGNKMSRLLHLFLLIFCDLKEHRPYLLAGLLRCFKSKIIMHPPFIFALQMTHWCTHAFDRVGCCSFFSSPRYFFQLTRPNTMWGVVTGWRLYNLRAFVWKQEKHGVVESMIVWMPTLIRP